MRSIALRGIVAAAGVLIATAACTSSGGMEGSRHALYDTVDVMAADSALVVVVDVTDSSRSGDLPRQPETVATATVLESYHPEGLAANDGRSPDEATGPGSVITVRQLGTAGMQATPAPILLSGSQYLLFLVPSGLPEAPPSEFYVTGGEAGIFAPADGTAGRGATTFHQVVDSDDPFPTVLPVDELG